MITSVEVVNNVNFPYEGGEERPPVFNNGEKIEFSPSKVNLIFGPNGSGKTTLLETIAKFTFCYEVGVPYISTTAVRDLDKFFTAKYYTSLRKYEATEKGLKIIKDKGLCYFMKSGKVIGLAGRTTKYPLEGFLEKAKKSWVLHRCSDGQIQSREMDRLFETLMEHQGQVLTKFYEFDEADKRTFKQAQEMTGTGEGLGTILLDEPDRNLDFIQSEILWNKLEELSKTYQIIVASHYVPALFRPNINLIPLRDTVYQDMGIVSYIEHCKSLSRG